jgi:hypothetical protein
MDEDRQNLDMATALSGIGPLRCALSSWRLGADAGRKGSPGFSRRIAESSGEGHSTIRVLSIGPLLSEGRTISSGEYVREGYCGATCAAALHKFRKSLASHRSCGVTVWAKLTNV